MDVLMLMYPNLLKGWWIYMDSINSILLNLMRYKTFSYSINYNCYNECADSIVTLFNELGFLVELMDTSLGKIIIGKYIIDSQYSYVHFNGHYDVVPPANKEEIGYQESESIFFGRGCSDMKGGIVAIWLACKDAIKKNLNVNLSFSFSPDEETGGKIASKKIVTELLGFLPKKAMIIIADSSYPNVITAHRGALWLEVTITLDSKKRFEKKAISAFEIMCRYYSDFMTTCDDTDVVIGGKCITSNAVNVWNYSTVFSLDYRFDAPFTLDEQIKWTEDHLSHLNDRIKSELSLFYNPLSWERLLEIEPCPQITDFRDILQIVQENIPQSKIEKGKGFYDLRYFRNEEFDNSFVLGPGDIYNAHVKKEKIKKENILNCAKAYLGLIERTQYENI